MKVFIGWDELDARAFDVNVKSLHAHASIQVETFKVADLGLRRCGLYKREYRVDQSGQKWDRGLGGIDETPFSTGFSFTRFLVPAMMGYRNEWCLFVDADVMWRDDVAKLLPLIDFDKAVMVVQHEHDPAEKDKMGGLIQTRYRRKNWSSVMLMNPSRCRALAPPIVSGATGAYLHGFDWLDDGEIGSLPLCWNWLEGTTDPAIDPAILHYTRGTPDMPGCADYAFANEFWGYAQ